MCEDLVKRAEAVYRSSCTAESFLNYLSAAREFCKFNKDVKQKYWIDFLHKLNACSQVWRFINKVSHHSFHFFIILLNMLRISLRSGFPPSTPAQLRSARLERLPRISGSRVTPSLCGDYATREELRLALSWGKATAPGDNGIPYAIFRLIVQVSGNFLLNMNL